MSETTGQSAVRRLFGRLVAVKNRMMVAAVMVAMATGPIIMPTTAEAAAQDPPTAPPPACDATCVNNVPKCTLVATVIVENEEGEEVNRFGIYLCG